MAILVTGAAGFVGFHTAKRLLERGERVIGVDNLNDYYDVTLKRARLDQLQSPQFTFLERDIADPAIVDALANLASDARAVIHLAAQAGVRYSIVNPYAYVVSNLMGHVAMLELAKRLPKLEHFVYASSSSVYGGNEKLPFSVGDDVTRPVSLYAATKVADEVITSTYCHLFGLAATGLRFFTVYGAWGRPDMAYFSFTKAIVEDRPSPIFNHGDMRRDFSYIDDVVDGILAAVERPPAPDDGGRRHRVYNLGNNRSEKLLDFVAVLEQALGKKARLDLQPMQPGDVPATWADIEDSRRDLGYDPKTPITVGLPKFVEWYKGYYRV